MFNLEAEEELDPLCSKLGQIDNVSDVRELDDPG